MAELDFQIDVQGTSYAATVLPPEEADDTINELVQKTLDRGMAFGTAYYCLKDMELGAVVTVMRRDGKAAVWFGSEAECLTFLETLAGEMEDNGLKDIAASLRSKLEEREDG